ncbi:MAG: ABC transporter permease [Burkholderiales bacterium]|nr:ABC transporter permease [Phycisphaerae bacterium]
MAPPLEYATPQPPEPAGAVNLRSLFSLLGPFIGLIAVFALFSFLEPQTFPTIDNMVLLLRTTAVVGVAALGMTLIIISGGIDLSVGAQIALSCVTTAWLLVAGVHPVIALAGGVASGAVCGLIIGMTITQIGLLPFIVTLGTFSALRGAAIGIADGRPIYVTGAKWLRSLLDVNSAILGLPPGVWMLLGLSVLVAAVLRYTRFGRHVFAVGSNEQTAILCGIPAGRVKVYVYLIGGALAGLAGVLQFSYVDTGDPTTAGGYELTIIAAVVIGGASLNGGRGSILGTLIGAMIMSMIDNGCTKHGYANWVQQIVTGVIIVAAAALDKLRQRAP